MAVLLGYGLSSHSSSCCRGREDGACQAALAQLETSRSMPRAPHCLVLRCIFVCIFLLCERRKRKQKARPLFKLAHSYTLGQILDTHARERPWTSWPRAESTREKSNASYSAQTFLACWPITSCGTYTITITTAFFSKRDTYSVSLSSFN